MLLEINIIWDGSSVAVGRAQGINVYTEEVMLSLQDIMEMPEELKACPVFLYGITVETFPESDNADMNFYKHDSVSFSSKRLVEALCSLIVANFVTGEALSIMEEVEECSEPASVE